MRRLAAGCHTGNRKLRIACLATLLCIIIVYLFQWPTDQQLAPKDIPTHLSSLRAVLTAYSNVTPLAGQYHSTQVPINCQVTENLLFKRSRCVTTESQRNMTPCPDCLRPGASMIQLYDVNTEFWNRTIFKNRFKPASGVVQNLISDYLITPSMDCPYLLAVQASMKDRPHERDLVRRTWGSVAETQTWPNRTINAKMKILFVVAHINKTEQEKQRNHTLQIVELLSEALIHNDILYIDMIDGYQHLTLKLLSAFKWVKDNCPCVKFVLKVDFDTFVNVPLLVDFLLLHEDRLNFSVVGMVYGGRNLVKRWGHWAMPRSLYALDYYPFYVSGCGYVLSIKAISQIVDAAPHFRIIPMEDAFITGILRQVLGYQLVGARDVFTHSHDKWFLLCQMFNDTRVLAMNSNGDQHQFIWDTFSKSTCLQN